MPEASEKFCTGRRCKWSETIAAEKSICRGSNRPGAHLNFLMAGHWWATRGKRDVTAGLAADMSRSCTVEALRKRKDADSTSPASKLPQSISLVSTRYLMRLPSAAHAHDMRQETCMGKHGLHARACTPCMSACKTGHASHALIWCQQQPAEHFGLPENCTVSCRQQGMHWRSAWT